VTASIAWPSFHPKMETEVDNQVAAPAETRTPNLHRANKIAHQECGWKGGDSRRLGREETLANEKQKNPLDSDRPSHGRRLQSSYERGCQEKKLFPAPREDAGVVTYIQPHLILRGVLGLVALARRTF
jgi:hypothetical protein